MKTSRPDYSPLSISRNSSIGNCLHNAAMPAMLMLASLRIAVCGYPPVSIPKIGSGASEPGRAKNSVSYWVDASFLITQFGSCYENFSTSDRSAQSCRWPRVGNWHNTFSLPSNRKNP